LSLPADLHGLKALVVDDNATVRHELCDLLESFHFNVSAVESGEKAIESFRRAAASEPYQLVLMDWKMPGLDGIETAEAIHNNPDLHRPPIILVTAYERELLQKRVGTASVDSLLLKPVKPSQLFNAITELFGRAEAMVPLREQTPAAQPIHRLAGLRVLVVEDSELNRDVAVALLEQAGLIVETAEDGRIAVDIVKESPRDHYNAVLMDIQMPVMDGYEATRHIREWEADSQVTGHRIPIIALTAHALTGEKEKCFAAGMDDYIAKPIDEKQLERVLLKRIASKQGEVDTSNRLQAGGTSDDHTALDVQGALKRIGGRSQIYVQVLKKFAPEFGKAHEVIRRYLAAHDKEAASRMAHSVKGAAAAIGAVRLSPVAAKLETAIKNEGPDIDVLLSDFNSELEQALKAVDRFLKTESE
jgi:CheY-like chemotaxis protein/HPt (histidine-containing phosphotransfer) domain-containing protein